MAKMTLLEITQDILSAMDSDDVNSIADTVESLQVAGAVKVTYDEIVSRLKLPELEKLVQLEGLADTDKPNVLHIPDNVTRLKWIKYRTDNTSSQYDEITYMNPEDFFLMTFNSTDDNQDSVLDPSGAISYWVWKDRDPKYWTTFDDEYIVFDAYDFDKGATLIGSKSLCWAEVESEFVMDDAFIPKLDQDLFPLLLAEAKSYCFINFKQVSNSKEEQKARRQIVSQQSKLWRANQRKPYDATPNYGRRGRRAV